MFGKKRNSVEVDVDNAQLQEVLSNRLKTLATKSGRLPEKNRLKPRKRVLHLALVRVSSDCAMSCTVRDITERGFRLEFVENIDLPETCEIEIPVLAIKCSAAVRWKNGNLAGVEILDILESAQVA